MKRSVFLVMFFAFGFLMTMAQDYSRYVDPRIGSEGLGRTFPGPCMPYGMAKPGPDAVSMPNAGWAPLLSLHTLHTLSDIYLFLLVFREYMVVMA